MPKESEIEETKGDQKESKDDDGQADLEQFGEEMMTKMMQDESSAVAEYNEVIAEISKICSHIMSN